LYEVSKFHASTTNAQHFIHVRETLGLPNIKSVCTNGIET